VNDAFYHTKTNFTKIPNPEVILKVTALQHCHSIYSNRQCILPLIQIQIALYTFIRTMIHGHSFRPLHHYGHRLLHRLLRGLSTRHGFAAVIRDRDLYISICCAGRLSRTQITTVRYSIRIIYDLCSHLSRYRRWLLWYVVSSLLS
jgi:hypothetical protein